MLHQDRGEYGEALLRYEQSLQIAEELGDRAGAARSLHNIGALHQYRGEYSEALRRYEQSLRIFEELGDRTGVASSIGQIGKLLMETGRYEEAFPSLLNALATLLQLQSPDARIVANNLRTLRARLGVQAFDAMWREVFNEDVPEWLREAGDEVS